MYGRYSRRRRPASKRRKPARKRATKRNPPKKKIGKLHSKVGKDGKRRYFAANGKMLSKKAFLSRKKASAARKKGGASRPKRNPPKRAGIRRRARRNPTTVTMGPIGKGLKRRKDKNGKWRHYLDGKQISEDRYKILAKQRAAATKLRQAARKKAYQEDDTGPVEAWKKHKKRSRAAKKGAATRAANKKKAATKKGTKAKPKKKGFYKTKGTDGKFHYFNNGKPTSKAKFDAAMKRKRATSKAKKAAPKKKAASKKTTTSKKGKKTMAKKAKRKGLHTSVGKDGRRRYFGGNGKMISRKEYTARKKRSGKTVSTFQTPHKRGGAAKRTRVKRYPARYKGVKTGNYTFNVVKNPSAAAKKMLMQGGKLYLGMLGVRVVGNMASKALVGTTLPASLTKFAGLLPSLAIFGVAAYGGKALGEHAGVFQQAAALSLFDSLVTNVVKPMLGKSSAISQMLGLDVEEALAYGYGEYLPELGEYLEEGADMGYGLDVEEALAEYTTDPGQELEMNGYGLDVEEALAADEQDAFATGYASGTLSHTVFNS